MHGNIDILVTKPLVIRRQQHDPVFPAEQFDQLYVRKHLDLEGDHTAQENFSNQEKERTKEDETH